MKKITALFLALTLCLSLCTVTAFAGNTISSLALEYSNKDYTTGSITWVNKDGMDIADTCTVYLYSEGEQIYGIQSGKYFDLTEGNKEIDKKELDWLKVDTAQYFIYIYTNSGDTFDDSFSLTINSTPFERKDDVWSLAIDGYNISQNKDALTISLKEDIKNETGDDDDVCNLDCETLAKVGMAAVGVVTAVVVTKVVVDKLHAIKAAKIAAAEEAKLAEMPMVAFGDSGDAVMTLQTELNAQGYDCGEVDGIFGQNTLNAVIAFQTAKGLTADGVVGELTWAALL